MKQNNEKQKRKVVKEIAKTSEAIRKKYLALKVGKMDAETNLQTNLRPIVEPLQQLVKNTVTTTPVDKNKFLYDDEEDQKDEEEDGEEEEEHSTAESIVTPVATKKKKTEKVRKLFKKNAYKILHSTPTTLKTAVASPADITTMKTPVQAQNVQIFESTANTSPTLESSMRKIFENSNTENNERSSFLLENLGPLAREYLHNFYMGTAKTVDNVYGVYHHDNKLMLGNLVFDVTNDDKIIVGGNKYDGTRGLYELIFKKIPKEETYTQTDLQNYKNILTISNAHKRGNQRMGNKGYKYRRIITPLFSPRSKKGSGITLPTSMLVTNKAIDYVHWDDPNELVERLRLLVSSQSAGHTAHNNEILSIIEELREAGMIIN